MKTGPTCQNLEVEKWWEKEIEKGIPRKSLYSSWQMKRVFPEGSIGQLWQVPLRDQAQEAKRHGHWFGDVTVMWP